MEEGWRSVVVNVRQQHVCQLRTFFHLEQISVLNNFGTVRKAKRIKYDIDEDAHQYWKAPFTHSFNRTQLVEYVVLDIVLLQDNQDDEEEEEVVEENKKEKDAAAVD